MCEGGHASIMDLLLMHNDLQHAAMQKAQLDRSNGKLHVIQNDFLKLFQEVCSVRMCFMTPQQLDDDAAPPHHAVSRPSATPASIGPQELLPVKVAPPKGAD